MSDSLQRLKLTLCCLILCFAPKLNASRIMYKDNSIQYPLLAYETFNIHKQIPITMDVNISISVLS